MKRIILITVTVLLVIGCTPVKNSDSVEMGGVKNQQAEYYNAYDEIDADTVSEVRSYAEVNIAYDNPSVLYGMADNVVLGTVLSIDGGDNYSEVTDSYGYAYTYGKLKVNRVLKGNLSEKEEIPYIRMGGIIPYEKFYESMHEAQKEKHGDASENDPYVKMVFGNDIDIEIEKEYLIYIVSPEKDEPAKKDHYMIIGWEGGLREIKIPDGDSAQSTDQLKVYNNFTQEWEKLSDVVKTDEAIE